MLSLFFLVGLFMPLFVFAFLFLKFLSLLLLLDGARWLTKPALLFTPRATMQWIITNMLFIACDLSSFCVSVRCRCDVISRFTYQATQFDSPHFAPFFLSSGVVYSCSVAAMASQRCFNDLGYGVDASLAGMDIRHRPHVFGVTPGQLVLDAGAPTVMLMAADMPCGQPVVRHHVEMK